MDRYIRPCVFSITGQNLRTLRYRYDTKRDLSYPETLNPVKSDPETKFIFLNIPKKKNLYSFLYGLIILCLKGLKLVQYLNKLCKQTHKLSR